MTYRFHTAISIFAKSLTFAPSHFCQKLEALVIWMDRSGIEKRTYLAYFTCNLLPQICFIINKEIPLFIGYYDVLK
jgi:hypothetical protein